jgi:hypothetical protein
MQPRSKPLSAVAVGWCRLRACLDERPAPGPSPCWYRWSGVTEREVSGGHTQSARDGKQEAARSTRHGLSCLGIAQCRLQTAKYIIPSCVSALSRLGSLVEMDAHACSVRTNSEAVLSGAARLQSLGISLLSIQLHHQTSEKVRVMVVGGRAGVYRCPGFWRSRQDARSTANTAVILVLEIDRRW